MTETMTTTAGTPMKHVAMASYVGSAIEYYDFYIYGTAAALVFPKVFFPHLGTTMATVASMATFAAAFISRPVGAAFFGHFGDRLGRKTTLTATLLIMGLSTVAVGVVPGAVTIGVARDFSLRTSRLSPTDPPCRPAQFKHHRPGAARRAGAKLTRARLSTDSNLS